MVKMEYVVLCVRGYTVNSCLDEHLALGARLDWRAVDGHGLAVTGELQGELLLHQLFDHLMDTNRGGSGET